LFLESSGALKEKKRMTTSHIAVRVNPANPDHHL
jgi:hypothetical protein